MALTDNLVSYYKLDSNSNDAHGSNNGTDSNMSYTTGKINNCGSFNGSNSRISIGNPANLQLNTVSISMWFKTANAGASYRNLIEKSTAWTILLKDNNLGTYEWGGSGDILSGQDPTDDNWHHVVLRQDHNVASGFTMYLDNSLVITDTYTANAQTGSIHIGAEGNSGTSQNYAGLLDEIGIWSRVITTDEVAALYNGGAGLAYPLLTDYSINVSDQINITESVTMQIVSSINVNDQINITESVTVRSEMNINVNDQITITESVTANVFFDGYSVDVNDQINITESVVIQNTELGGINVSDQINISDVPNFTGDLGNISVSDDITITESVSMTGELNLSVADSINITDVPTPGLVNNISVSDSITITESVSMFIPQPPTGLAHMRSKEQEWPFGMDDETIL